MVIGILTLHSLCGWRPSVVWGQKRHWRTCGNVQQKWVGYYLWRFMGWHGCSSCVQPAWVLRNRLAFIIGYCLRELYSCFLLKALMKVFMHAWAIYSLTTHTHTMYTLLMSTFIFCTHRCCSCHIIHWWHWVNPSWQCWLHWEWDAADWLLSQWAWSTWLHPCRWCGCSLPPTRYVWMIRPLWECLS